MKKSIIALVLSLFTTSSIACIAPPMETHREHNDLIENASSIVLVTIEATKDNTCDYKLEEVLKQNGVLELPACILEDTNSESWIPEHDSTEFWAFKQGRIKTEPNCELEKIKFIVGRRYLIFTGIEPDSKQYEEIKFYESQVEDKWLEYTRKQLQDMVSM